MIEAEVYVVENKIPFLLGGSLLRWQKTEISVSDNKMTVNGTTMKLILMKSGHMAIPWTTKTHKLEGSNSTVLLTQKIPRKEWSTPEVRKAMHKEWTNLQENGTYEEVRREPWMTMIPTMWVIN